MGNYRNYMNVNLNIIALKLNRKQFTAFYKKMLQTLCPSEYDTPISITGGCFLCGMKKGYIVCIFPTYSNVHICVSLSV